MAVHELPDTPNRTVIQGEAWQWLSQNSAASDDSVVTSLPDVSELSGTSLGQWREWFVESARRIVTWIPKNGVAIFYQSDIRYEGQWIDKGYLVHQAMEREGAYLLWHKIVCRRPAGTIALGRPSFSHMLCVAREPRSRAMLRPGPDVLADAGYMPWSRAMGVNACRVACRFILDETDCRRVVDPFCGQGTVLAVANEMGLHSLGIELGAKRCRIARNLRLEEKSSLSG